MSTNNDTTVTPNTGSTAQTASQPNSQVGEPLGSNPPEINSGENQQQSSGNREPTTGNEEHVSGTSGNFLIANAALASCNTTLKDYHSSRISKGTALCRIYTILLEAVPDDESMPATVEEAFNRFLTIIENHQGHLAEAERHGRHQHSESPPQGNRGDEELEDISPPKRAKPDDSKFPWTVSDFIHGATLSPSLSSSLELLKLYAIDLKTTKRSLINSPTCPEFPDSEWTNVLAGRAVNLDAVLTGYYSTSNNDERVEEIGDFEIHFGTVNLTKLVSSAGEWSIAWNRTSRAICTAFPHRAGELGQYAEYIVGLFAATDVHFHDHIIFFDKAVHRRVGARRDLELTDFDKFFDLKSTHMDSIGAAVIQHTMVTTLSKPPGTSCKKVPEPCNRWNEGLCTLESTQCRRLHVCSKFLFSGHKSADCPSKQ
ncbi:hypothetical protein K443DRAFT_102433 [Laccaria amethystina LaAM-08-1]|uniref:C3H1-type domain-containing protein n=1 Tax=Laccaria amethystina LaAM-08-1 TaxID=1095629 RepID=A0A0C9WNS4_9AGAR|nr:hypothetical protein K443DRAFT_102433 [Laccaria amethystina LaAM-08-1]